MHAYILVGNPLGYLRMAKTPQSALILHPREIQALWSQTYDTGVGISSSTSYDRRVTDVLCCRG